MTGDWWADLQIPDVPEVPDGGNQAEPTFAGSRNANATAIESTLVASGWRIASRSDHLVRLLPPGPEGASILLPTDLVAPDAPYLLAEAQRQLEAIPALAQALRARLQAGSRDTLLFRKESNAPSGTISWAAGEDFVASAKRLLVAGAKTYIAPAKRFRQTHGKFATRYLDSVLMGQTAPGSYVLSALVPVEDRVPINSQSLRAPERAHEVDVPAARLITLKVIEAVQASAEALEDFRRRRSASQAEAFTDRVASGVSFDLLTALLGIIDQSTESDVSIDWFPTDDTALAPSGLDRQFRFTPDDYAALEKAAVSLASDTAPRRVMRSGYIQVLRKPEVGAPTVVTVVAAEPTGAPRRYRVRLTQAEQLRLATRAYEVDTPVLVEGVAERDGSQWWLYDATLRIQPPASGAPQDLLDWDSDA